MNKPCLDCGVLADKPRCPICNKKYQKFKATSRPSRADRGYDANWKRLSKQLRLLQPYCSICKATNDLTVDHIIPLSSGGFTVESNLQVLCRRCNSSKGSSSPE
jgi:5-methylcytosine-specific restriction endonuclease McrA